MSAKIPTRRLGKNGPHIPALSLGLMGLSSFYGKASPDEERFEFLDRAYELGCRHWDSAALYGDSEVLLGKWFQRTGKRKDIFLATKFGNHITPDGGREMRNDPDYIRQAVAQSLRRLQTDYIDLLYCHRISGKTPIEDIVTTMKEFVDSGQVRYVGLSECGVDTLQRASKIHPISAYQIEYSPFSMDIEKPEIGLLKTCRELGIATVAYSPLGRGMLTGQYKSIDDFEESDFRRSIPRFSPDNFGKNIQLVDTLRHIADRKGCTPGQLTLAWMMNQDNDILPIPGTKKIRYLEENWGANDVSLTPEEDRQIRQVIELAEVHGTRVAEHLMGALVKDTPPLSK
ncbi:putative aldo-keto reductase [Hypoxylon sp. NC1633]|nr:putative aldo-keto reductase [Hypoxylon sp. NC1633]